MKNHMLLVMGFGVLISLLGYIVSDWCSLCWWFGGFCLVISLVCVFVCRVLCFMEKEAHRHEE